MRHVLSHTVCDTTIWRLFGHLQIWGEASLTKACHNTSSAGVLKFCNGFSLTQASWFRYSSSIGGFRSDELNSLPHMQAGSVTIRWTTSKPYESTIVCTAVQCQLVGLDIRHASPSVANNFAVYNQVCLRRHCYQNVAAWICSNVCSKLYCAVTVSTLDDHMRYSRGMQVFFKFGEISGSSDLKLSVLT